MNEVKFENQEAQVINEELDISRIKLEINNLIWMYGSPKMTLGHAEDLALRMLNDFSEAYNFSSKEQCLQINE